MAYSEILRLGLMDLDIELRHGGDHTAYGPIMDELRQYICMKCDFREEDCDFISSNGYLYPCGGLFVLTDLISTGKIKLDDVK